MCIAQATNGTSASTKTSALAVCDKISGDDNGIEACIKSVVDGR